VPDATAVSPDGYWLGNFYLARAGADEIQLDLFGDYKSNVALYSTFKRDISGATVHSFNTGHFALETHANKLGNDPHAAFRSLIKARRGRCS